MKQLLTVIFSIIITSVLLSCDENNTDNKNNNNSDNSDNISIVKLIDIPEKINEETQRYEIDADVIAIDVFSANIAMNEGNNILQKMFPNAKITTAEATEVFDSFNITNSNNNGYCGILTYEQNNKEEFVIHTIFIAEGLFSEDILGKIFS